MANIVVEGNLRGANFQKVGGKWQLGGIDRMSHVVGYEVATEGRRIKSGGVAAGVALVALGPIGLAGGLLAARKKRLCVLTWKNGEESLVEVTSPDLHAALLKAAFANRR